MFSAVSLNHMLDKHSVFNEIASSETQTDNKSSKAQQILHIQGGNLFVWDDKHSCLRNTNLRSDINDSNTLEDVQFLLCRNPPLFEVQSIIFNQSSNHVALVGSRGVTVLVLPHRFGKDAEYEGGKRKITCRTIPVAERFFTTNISVQLIQASWYPDESFLHLCLLTSDNSLRIYNVQSDSQMPVQTHKLGQMLENSMSLAGSRMSLMSMYSVTSSLGETVVAFDFASPIEYIPKPKLLSNKDPKPIKLQPIYLLQGNGDVLILLTSLSSNKFSKGVLHGPLIMLPSAEDNYGTESCSIRVMKSSPSVIVIATATGKLYHCIALWSNNFDEDHDAGDFDAQSMISRESLSRIELSEGGEVIAPTLYVYETVELELDLTVSDDEPESHDITLHEDPVLPFRYHCCTSVGIHSIAMPWIDKLGAFVNADDENKEVLSDLAQGDPCVVEHVLCTKPTLSSPDCNIIGLTVAADPMFGPSLICLTDDCHCSAVPLLSTFRPSSPPLMSYIEDDTLSTSPLKKLSETNFVDHIRSLLKRDASQPIIRAGAWNDEANDRECLQLLTRATQVFRDEYILKQKLARDAISKRVMLLNEQKGQQLEDLQELNDTKASITTNAEQIANDYEDCQERQQVLLERLELVVKRVKESDPYLSKAEVSMGKELKSLSSKLRQLDNNIKQLKIKQEYQEKKQEKGSGLRKNFPPGGSIASMSLQTEKFKQIILEEGEKISELIKKLNNMNVQVGL
ncbi:nucleoporin 88-like [Clavelina lepadiformis]|uniref:nucleoporin 88-like n=1 Tax=Clavelina lepadiformis TaxID=159417 RepID=UPI00404199DF